jgi:hypothetical protein
VAAEATEVHRTTALELTALGSLRTLLATELGTHGATALELATLGSLRTLVTTELMTTGTTTLGLTALGTLMTATHTGLLAGELGAVVLEEVYLSGVSLLSADLTVFVGVVLSDEGGLGVNLRRGSSYRSRSCLLCEQGHSCYECEDDGILHNRVF